MTAKVLYDDTRVYFAYDVLQEIGSGVDATETTAFGHDSAEMYLGPDA